MTDDEIKEYLFHLHYNERLSKLQISKLLSCSRRKIDTLFDIYNIIGINHNSLKEKCGFENEQQMAVEFSKLHHDKLMTQKQISDIYNISVQSVYKIFKIFNIQSNYIINTPDINPTDHELEIITAVLLSGGRIIQNKHSAYLEYSIKSEKVANDISLRLSNFGSKIIYKSYKNKGSGYIVKTSSFRYFQNLKINDLINNITGEILYWIYVKTGSSSKNYITIRPSHNINIPIDHKISNGLIKIYKTSDRQALLRLIGPCRHQDYAHKWVILNKNGINIGY